MAPHQQMCSTNKWLCWHDHNVYELQSPMISGKVVQSTSTIAELQKSDWGLHYKQLC